MQDVNYFKKEIMKEVYNIPLVFFPFVLFFFLILLKEREGLQE